jgi:ubiquinone/menaquinone biosynthesis C-methylase UbiE
VNTSDWHTQFQRQAQWTQATRNRLYRRANLLRAERTLDVGCGTGVLTEELLRRTRGEVTGLDVDPAMVAYARECGGAARYEEGDALDLPYPDGHFDVVACHFLLLWVADPARAVSEMARVTSPGGAVLVCAEPDYGGRLDWPELPIREWQVEGLRRQGADPLIGRRLRQLLVAAQLDSDVGVLPSLWDADDLRENFEREWAWLAHDVGQAVDPATFARVQDSARAAVEAGTRLVYLPIFYALGRTRLAL